MENVLACPLGKRVEGPRENKVDLVAYPRKDGEDRAVAVEKQEAKEVKESDTKTEARKRRPVHRNRFYFRH